MKKVIAKKRGRPSKTKIIQVEVPIIVKQSNAIEPTNGIELLTIETDVKMRKFVHFELDPNYIKLKQLIPQLQVGQSIPIRSEWKRWTSKIVKDLELAIKIMVYTIADNPKFKRVYRIK